MEERLKYVFEQVNHFLSFAEAKNAMLIVFNITLLIAMGSFLISYTLSLWLICILQEKIPHYCKTFSPPPEWGILVRQSQITTANRSHDLVTFNDNFPDFLPYPRPSFVH